MVSLRRGAGKIGCLFTLLVAAAVVYFGVKVGEPYWRYYQYKDAMTEQARFAGHFTDDQIKNRLALLADSLGLPADAGAVFVTRKGEHISIRADYVEMLELPGHVREIKFAPSVEYDY